MSDETTPPFPPPQNTPFPPSETPPQPTQGAAPPPQAPPFSPQSSQSSQSSPFPPQTPQAPPQSSSQTPRRSHPGTTVAALLAATVLGAGAAAVLTASLVHSDNTTITREVTVSSGSSSTPASSVTSVRGVYDRAKNSVVEIHVNTTTQLGQQGEAQGSGFVYDRAGHVITNDHVVDGATSVRVQFPNGQTYPASVVGTDPTTDLAGIKVDAPTDVVTPLSVGDSAALAVGDPVVAIGSPFGLENTVTLGIVSALHRSMTAPNNFTINDSIQTDAAINHGNSGGPLLNLRGQVVGVNAQIESDSGDNAGIGFAIPSNTVKSIADQLIATGHVRHAYLGVSIEAIPASAASQLGVPAGLAVQKVESGYAAEKAGLQAGTGQTQVDGETYPTGGDVITAVDGQTVTTAPELQSAIDAHKPGDKVQLTITRGGQSKTVTVTLSTKPAQAPS